MKGGGDALCSECIQRSAQLTVLLVLTYNQSGMSKTFIDELESLHITPFKAHTDSLKALWNDRPRHVLSQ